MDEIQVLIMADGKKMSFEPKDDITAYESAIICKLLSYASVCGLDENLVDEYLKKYTTIIRHFEEI
jgi:hypothetical protein